MASICDCKHCRDAFAARRPALVIVTAGDLHADFLTTDIGVTSLGTYRVAELKRRPVESVPHTVFELAFGRVLGLAEYPCHDWREFLRERYARGVRWLKLVEIGEGRR